MNMKKINSIIIFLSLFLYLLHIPVLSRTIELKSNLYFSENPISFEPPIIKREGTLLIPIRSLVSYFDGSIQQSNKNYTFTIRIKNHTFKIKQNVKNYNHNGQKKTFPLKPIKYKTRLYVPFNAFLNDLGYAIAKKNNHYYAYRSQQKESPPIQKTESKFTYIYPKLPQKITSIYLPISKINIPLKQIEYMNNDYVDLSEFLKYLGYKVTIIKNNILLKK